MQIRFNCPHGAILWIKLRPSLWYILFRLIVTAHFKKRNSLSTYRLFLIFAELSLPFILHPLHYKIKFARGIVKMNAKYTWGFNPKWLTSNNETRNASDFFSSTQHPKHRQKLHNFNLWSRVILNTKENEYINLGNFYDRNYFVLREFKIIFHKGMYWVWFSSKMSNWSSVSEYNEIIRNVLYSFDFCWNFFSIFSHFFLFRVDGNTLRYSNGTKEKWGKFCWHIML